MVRAGVFAAIVVGAVVVAAPMTACAHGIGGGRLHIELDGDTLYVLTTPSMALFSGFDRNKDGRLTKAEVRGRRDAMIADFLGHLQLRDDRGRAGKIVFSDLNPLHTHSRKRRGKHIRMNIRLRFSAPPVSIWLAYDAAKRAPLGLMAARSENDRKRRGQKVTTGKLDRDNIVLTLLRQDRRPKAGKTPDKRRRKAR